MALKRYLCLLLLQLLVAEGSLSQPVLTVTTQTRQIRTQTKYTGSSCCFAITTSVRCANNKSQSYKITSRCPRIIALPSPPTTLSVTASENDATQMLQSSSSSEFSRRKAIISAMAGLSAEEAWCRAVAVADTTSPIGERLLPPGAIETIESGKALVVENWLPPDEVSALRADVRSCYDGGYFRAFVNAYSRNAQKGEANDRKMMPSFSAARDATGPFADPDIGNFRARQNLKARMAMVKATLSKELHDRPTLASDAERTHEIEYLRYGAGASLIRHIDERHVELKRPGGSRLPKRPGATRRSITWLVFLNEDNWSVDTGDGGQLRFHKRAESTVVPVGANGPDLQVAWLRATSAKTDGDLAEKPVFLDALRPGPDEESCVLYVIEENGTTKRDLSRKPFANAALFLGGGDAVAKSIMVDDPADAARFHLIGAPKTFASALLPTVGERGEDGGERIDDVAPLGGTLVMFDSVSLPHEVLKTNRERFAIQGWFHEKLYT